MRKVASQLSILEQGNRLHSNSSVYFSKTPPPPEREEPDKDDVNIVAANQTCQQGTNHYSSNGCEQVRQNRNKLYRIVKQLKKEV